MHDVLHAVAVLQMRRFGQGKVVTAAGHEPSVVPSQKAPIAVADVHCPKHPEFVHCSAEH